MANTRSIPISWRELLIQAAEDFQRDQDTLDETIEELPERSERDLAMELYLPALILGEAAIALGPAVTAPYHARLVPFLPPAVRSLAGGPTRTRLAPTIRVLDYTATARASDVAVPAEAVAVEVPWLRALAPLRPELDEQASEALAFAALAGGAEDLVPAFLGGGPLATTIQPGETFGLNAQKYVRYMAAAAKAGAALADVEPAWIDFVRNFPRKLGAESLTWVELLHAGRAHYTRFAGQPPGRAAASLHALVTE
jgi:hypothetical protein